MKRGEVIAALTNLVNDDSKKTERKFIKKQLNLAQNRKAEVVVNKIRGLTNK